MPARGGTQLTTSLGRCLSHARTMTSRRRAYSPRKCTSQSRYPTCPHRSSSSLNSSSWLKPLGPCVLASTCMRYLSTICSAAVIHPTRHPGATTLEKLSRRMTRPSTSMERKLGISPARNPARLATLAAHAGAPYSGIWRK
jgi:hypothetical protein